MSEMIERVAMAIHSATPGRENSPAKLTPATMLMARAAIEAMREPTVDMIDAAYEAVEFNDKWRIADLDDYLKAHHAMIDAAIPPAQRSPIEKTEASQ